MQWMMTSGSYFFVCSNYCGTIACIGHSEIFSYHITPLSPLWITFTSFSPLYISNSFGSQRTVNSCANVAVLWSASHACSHSTCSTTNFLYSSRLNSMSRALPDTPILCFSSCLFYSSTTALIIKQAFIIFLPKRRGFVVYTYAWWQVLTFITFSINIKWINTIYFRHKGFLVEVL